MRIDVHKKTLKAGKACSKESIHLCDKHEKLGRPAKFVKQMNAKTPAPIIFVWIGSELPEWGPITLNFAADNNKDREVILVTDNGNYGNQILSENITVVRLQALELKASKLNSTSLIKGDFWRLTSQRISVLSNYARSKNMQRFFHAELDNAIFALGTLDEVLDKVGTGLFAPQDNEERAIASLVYCNHKESIDELLEMYQGPYNARNDMQALGMYAKISSNFFALPTESFRQNMNRWKIIEPSITGGIFDAASIGQYCLGIYPIHCRYSPSRNRFINENCLINWDETIISTDGEILRLHLRGEEVIGIYNIHVHSKQLRKIKALLRNERIMRRLSDGKSTIVTGRSKFLTGPCLLVLHWCTGKILRILKKLDRLTKVCDAHKDLG